MKSKVIRELTLNELKERLDEEQQQLIKLKLNHSISPLENPMKIVTYRKTVARLKTDLQRRLIEENKKNDVKNK
ncbi:MAG: 50S ribosomal protein L29 [Bacteroidales bacterium]|nr:50S ribosomal protein L29 [Bacteroidales bacterium]